MRLRLLFDTHALIWWLTDSRRLSESVRNSIFDPSNEKLVSVATTWEISAKHRLGRLPEAHDLALDLAGTIARQGFDELPIALADAERAGALPGPLSEPFDRMINAQALSRGLVLVSNESPFDRYGVRRL